MTERRTATNMNKRQHRQANNMPPDEPAANPTNDAEKVPMALISIAQRNSLIEYMAKQPYQDVANGIEFLRNAPIVEVNLTINNPEATDDGGAN